MSEWPQTLLNNFITGAVMAAIVSAVLSVLFARQRGRIEEKVRLEFAQLRAIDEARQGWKIRAISELFAPIVAHLDRSFSFFQRYLGVPRFEQAKSDREVQKLRDEQLFLEAMMKGIHETARNLLLEKFFLVPPDLRTHASKLITHYDRWLEIYHAKRTQLPPEEWEGFVFAGTDKNSPEPFPRDAENAFRA